MKVLRTIRKSRSLTQKALADKAGLTQVFISHLERGTREADDEVWRRLGAALGVPGHALRANEAHPWSRD